VRVYRAFGIAVILGSRWEVSQIKLLHRVTSSVGECIKKIPQGYHVHKNPRRVKGGDMFPGFHGESK
jgi:hypothetical protein